MPTTQKLKIALVIVFSALGFFGLGFSAEGVRALASDKSNFIQECERRNVLQGCNCFCRETPPFFNGEELLHRCQQGKSSCDEVNREYAMFESNGNYLEGYTGNGFQVIVPKDQISSGSSNQFIFFPNLGNGLIALNSDGSINLGGSISRVLFLIFLLAIVVAVGIAFYGGFQIVTAGGDDEKAQAGRNTLKNGIIGFLLAAAAALIVAIASTVLGFGLNSGTPDEIINNAPSVQQDDADKLNDILVENSN